MTNTPIRVGQPVHGAYLDPATGKVVLESATVEDMGAGFVGLSRPLGPRAIRSIFTVDEIGLLLHLTPGAALRDLLGRLNARHARLCREMQAIDDGIGDAAAMLAEIEGGGTR